jgi:hypothetical protein
MILSLLEIKTLIILNLLLQDLLNSPIPFLRVSGTLLEIRLFDECFKCL